MNLSDWIISISATAIGTLMALLAFFANKWIESIDARLSVNSKATETLSKDFKRIETEIQKQTVEIPARVGRAYDTADKLHHRRLAEGLADSSNKIQRLEVVLREKVFPQLEKVDEVNGKVIVLEQSLDRLISGLKKLQKPPQQ